MNRPSPLRRFAKGLSCAVAGALATAAALEAQTLGRLATVGDSVTDEYFEESYDYARSWTEIAVSEMGLDLGPLPSALGAGTWGEPRRTGYEDNWARYGASTDSAIADGQHTGAAAGIASRGVTHAVVALGINDFDPTASPFLSIYFGVWSPAQIDTWLAGRAANLATILDTLSAGDARLVISNVPDFTAFALFRQLFTSSAGATRVAQALDNLGARIRTLARDRRLVLVDQLEFSRAVYGTHGAPAATLELGAVDIDLEAWDTTTGSNPLAAFVDDGVHPNTIPQGVLANLMVEALNVYGAGVTPLTEAEILDLAAVAYGGSDTLEGEIGPLANYVENYWSLLVDGFEDATTGAWSSATP